MNCQAILPSLSVYFPLKFFFFHTKAAPLPPPFKSQKWHMAVVKSMDLNIF